MYIEYINFVVHPSIDFYAIAFSVIIFSYLSFRMITFVVYENNH